MKMFLFLLTVFPQFVLASPITCFKATQDDELLRKLPYHSSRLCRKAKSSAPYECFNYTYRRDFNLSFQMVVDMCQSVENAFEPAKCFDQMLKEYPGIRHITASTLCSATTVADKSIACFKEVQKTYGFDFDKAAILCAH